MRRHNFSIALSSMLLFSACDASVGGEECDDGSCLEDLAAPGLLPPDLVVSINETAARVRGQLLRQDVRGFLTAVDFGPVSVAVADITSPHFLRECQRTQHELARGSCEVLLCPDAVALPDSISAGTARIRGGLQKITMVPNPDGAYDLAVQEGALFTGGENLLLSLSGQFQPPIVLSAARLVQAPTKTIRLTSPRPTTISRQQPFTSTWTGVSSPTDVLIFINSEERVVEAPGLSVAKFSVDCEFDSSAGEGTIPASVLSQLPAGGFINGYRVKNSKTQDIASQQISFTLGATVADGDSQLVTLE